MSLNSKYSQLFSLHYEKHHSGHIYPIFDKDKQHMRLYPDRKSNVVIAIQWKNLDSIKLKAFLSVVSMEKLHKYANMANNKAKSQYLATQQSCLLLIWYHINWQRPETLSSGEKQKEKNLFYKSLSNLRWRLQDLCFISPAGERDASSFTRR